MRGSEIILPGSVDNHMEIGCVFVRNNQTVGKVRCYGYNKATS